MEQEQELPTMQDDRDTNEEDYPPTIEEVEMAIQKLKKSMAPGTDNVPAELFRYGGNKIVKHTSLYRKFGQRQKCRQIGTQV